MASWAELEAARPQLAEAGRALFYHYGGVGLGFLATVRRDGGPRMHPICPLLLDGELYAFIMPGPKRGDLLRDGRYAMHSHPTEHNEDAFYLTGAATEVSDGVTIERAAAQFFAERHWTEAPPDWDGQRLFRFEIERCLHTQTEGFGDFHPRHTVWHAPEA